MTEPNSDNPKAEATGRDVIAMAAADHAFSPSQSVLISRLAGALQFVGLVFLVIGGVVATGGIVSIALIAIGRVVQLAGFAAVFWGGGMLALSAVIGGIVYGLQGAGLMRSATSFKRVTSTEGTHIENLMEAFDNLQKFYAAAAFLTVLASIGAVLALVRP
jgi:hypothetical protein